MAKEFAGVDGTGAASLTIGDTTITAVISKDYKLNSLTVVSPFALTMSGSAEGMNFLMAISGNSNYKYVIKR